MAEKNMANVIENEKSTSRPKDHNLKETGLLAEDDEAH